MSLASGLVAILGLALLSVLTRGFFFLTEKELPIPTWLQQGLRYAPLAALAAVVAPDVLMSQGSLVSTWRDPRLFAAATGLGYYFWRRGILGTILAGMAVFAALRFGLGW